jgi:hypothetical protein
MLFQERRLKFDHFSSTSTSTTTTSSKQEPCDPDVGILAAGASSSREEQNEQHHRRHLQASAYEYFCTPGFQTTLDCRCGRPVAGERTVRCVYPDRWCRYNLQQQDDCVDAEYEFVLHNNDLDIARMQVCLDLRVRNAVGQSRLVTSCYAFDYASDPQQCMYSQNGMECTSGEVRPRGGT